MMTSSNENIFRVTGHFCGEFTGPRWILRTKASDAELWCFFFIWTWINSWVNNSEAGDWRRHQAHCDVSVMINNFLYSDIFLIFHHCQNTGSNNTLIFDMCRCSPAAVTTVKMKVIQRTQQVILINEIFTQISLYTFINKSCIEKCVYCSEVLLERVW